MLRLFVGTKFLAIAVSMLCLARSMFLHGYLGKLFAALSLVLVPVTMLALEGNPPLIELMTLLIMLGWVVLLIWLMQMRNGFSPGESS